MVLIGDMWSSVASRLIGSTEPFTRSSAMGLQQQATTSRATPARQTRQMSANAAVELQQRALLVPAMVLTFAAAAVQDATSRATPARQMSANAAVELQQRALLVPALMLAFTAAAVQDATRRPEPARKMLAHVNQEHLPKETNARRTGKKSAPHATMAGNRIPKNA